VKRISLCLFYDRKIIMSTVFGKIF
jgi:hypothetical protein